MWKIAPIVIFSYYIFVNCVGRYSLSAQSNEHFTNTFLVKMYHLNFKITYSEG